MVHSHPLSSQPADASLPSPFLTLRLSGDCLLLSVSPHRTNEIPKAGLGVGKGQLPARDLPAMAPRGHFSGPLSTVQCPLRGHTRGVFAPTPFLPGANGVAAVQRVEGAHGKSLGISPTMGQVKSLSRASQLG
jgi:hypothetical protein